MCTFLNKEKPFALLKICLPYSGILTFENNQLTISSNLKKITIDLFSLTKEIINCKVKIWYIFGYMSREFRPYIFSC